ncbi:MAG: hypothetical protein RLZZ58_694 [Pseudomonadota bacterium]
MIHPPIDSFRVAAARRSPHHRLSHALTQRLGRMLRLVDSRETPWASATFTGARHRFHFVVEDVPMGTAERGRITALAEAEWGLHGHVVADVALRWGYTEPQAGHDPIMLNVEMLTVADAAA